MEHNGILIYGELTDKYEIRPVVKQLITKSAQYSDGLKIKICLIGKRRDYEEIINDLAGYGADEVIIVSDNRLKEYDSNYFGEVFYQIAQKYKSGVILIGATSQGKEIASFTAAKLNTGLTADCTNINIENNLLLSTRPTFGGKLTADILCKTFPQMATVKENVFKAEIKQSEHNVNVIFDWIDIDKIEKKIEVVDIEQKISLEKDVTEADIVIAGGAGACFSGGFELIYKLAKKINAATAGSREAVERGFIDKSRQIGQTGKTIAPKLYIAVGISGANQHLAGIKNSGTIIAINKDENAPIFKYADYGIKGDLVEILNELIEKI